MLGGTTERNSTKKHTVKTMNTIDLPPYEKSLISKNKFYEKDEKD
jgi:hypothetical protein